MSNYRWQHQIVAKYPQYNSDVNNEWTNVIIDVLDKLVAEEPNLNDVQSLTGITQSCKRYFTYLTKSIHVESTVKKIKKLFFANQHLPVFDDYRDYFPKLFIERHEVALKPKPKLNPKPSNNKITSFVAKEYKYNISSSSNSIDFNIVNLNIEETKFLHNHIVDGINLLSIK